MENNKQSETQEKVSVKDNVSSQGSGKTTGKSNGCLIAIIIGIAVVIILAIGGYVVGKIFVGKAKDSLESAVSAGTGGKVSLDTDKGSLKVSENGQTLEVGTKNSWPPEMPSEVPRYNSGEIQSASTFDNATSKTWAIIIAKTDEASYKAYDNELSSSGWSKEEMPTGILNLIQYKKNDLTLTLAFDSSSKGVNLTVLKNLQK